MDELKYFEQPNLEVLTSVLGDRHFKNIVLKNIDLKNYFLNSYGQLLLKPWHTYEVVGFMIATTVGCSVIGARLPGLRLFNSICTPTVMIGVEGIQEIYIEQNYAEALQTVCESPYGSRLSRFRPGVPPGKLTVRSIG